jgi:hypothetical protein
MDEIAATDKIEILAVDDHPLGSAQSIGIFISIDIAMPDKSRVELLK